MTSHVVYNILTNWKIIYIFKITGWNHMKLRLLIWRKLIWRKSSSCWTNRQRPLIWRKSLTSSCYNSNSIVPRKNVSLKKSSLSDIVGFATALDFSLELFKLVKICSSCNNSKLFQTEEKNQFDFGNQKVWNLVIYRGDGTTCTMFSSLIVCMHIQRFKWFHSIILNIYIGF